jgi:acyl dehydratase
VIGRYLEDFAAGDEIVSAGRTLTEEAIIAFAALYDPQSFHIDVEAATKSSYGGLIASGFQTLAVGFRAWTRCVGSNRCGPATRCIRSSASSTRGPRHRNPTAGSCAFTCASATGAMKTC